MFADLLQSNQSALDDRDSTKASEIRAQTCRVTRTDELGAREEHDDTPSCTMQEFADALRSLLHGVDRCGRH
jgi:hypothetical protein